MKILYAVTYMPHTPNTVAFLFSGVHYDLFCCTVKTNQVPNNISSSKVSIWPGFLFLEAGQSKSARSLTLSWNMTRVGI